ncbi:MAG: 6-carboxytetrahydropterin synthase QueD [Desulfobacteraceae bacterium]|jgi:6-pyruvoyltetrahydropterin/6-carboxytetrahydropterin synthase
MYELKILTQFSAAHQLREHGGKCEQMHGHNWKVEVYVRGEDLDENGLLIDFHDVKAAAAEVIEGLDHKYLNEVPPFDHANPSSENIARHIFESLGRRLNNARVIVSRVTAWESDTACASYASP